MRGISVLKGGSYTAFVHMAGSHFILHHPQDLSPLGIWRGTDCEPHAEGRWVRTMTDTQAVRLLLQARVPNTPFLGALYFTGEGE